MGDDEKWPQWPQDAKSQRIVDVQVGCGAEELFTLLWAPKSPYVTQAQERIGNKDWVESWWAPEAELTAGGKGSPPKKPLRPAEYKGLARRTSCSGSGMGIKYVNTEIQRCNRAAEGGPFEVDVIVHTTATYGDRFRPILRHRISAAGPARCCYTVDYALVYIVSTNSLLKKAIERGAYGGVAKNFEILVDVLSKFKAVQKTAEARAAAAAAPGSDGPAAPAPAAAAVVLHPLPWWAAGVSPQTALLMERPAAWLRGATGLGGTPQSAGSPANCRLSGKHPEGGTAEPDTDAEQELLCTPEGKGAGAAADARGSGLAAALACGALTLVLASMLFLLQASHASCAASKGTAGRLCAAALGALDVPGSLRQVLTAVVLLAGANALTAAATAWLAGRLPAASRGVRRATGSMDAADQPTAGIRFEGFEQSLQSAAANIARGEGELQQQAAAGGRDGGEGSGRRRAEGTKLRDTLKYVGLGGLMDSKKERERPRAGQAGNGEAAAGSSPPRPADGSHMRSLTMPAAPAGLAQLLTDDEEASTGASSAKASSTFRDYMNPAGLLDKTETMFAQWSGANKAPKLEQDAALAKAEAIATSATELANLREPEEGVGPLEEEVFENERYQPFRGWGHQWPGHFLPTDRVGHWSTAASMLNPALDSSSFDAIAPRLRPGWEWAEESWQIDMRGIVENGVDEEGWAYATDFGWMQWPPLPGSGRFKRVRDYVRRRRWIRNRVFTGRNLQGGSPIRPPRSEFADGSAHAPEASAASSPSLQARAGSGALEEAARPGSRRASGEVASRSGSVGSLQPASRKASLDAALPEAAVPVPAVRGREAGRRAEPTSEDGHLLPLSPPSRVLSPVGGRPAGEGFGSRFTDKMSSMFAAASSSLRDAKQPEARPPRQGSLESRSSGGRAAPPHRQGSLDGGGAVASRQPSASRLSQPGPPVLERATAPPTEHPASAPPPVRPDIATAGSSGQAEAPQDLAAYFGIKTDEQPAQPQPAAPASGHSGAREPEPAATVRLALRCEGERVHVRLNAATAAAAEAVETEPAAAEARSAQQEPRAALGPAGGAARGPEPAAPRPKPLPRSDSGSSERGERRREPAPAGGKGWASEALGVFRQATGAIDDLQREWQGKISSSFKAASEGAGGGGGGGAKQAEAKRSEGKSD